MGGREVGGDPQALHSSVCLWGAQPHSHGMLCGAAALVGLPKTGGDARGGGVMGGVPQLGCPVNEGASLIGVPRDGGAPLMGVFGGQRDTPEGRVHH